MKRIVLMFVACLCVLSVSAIDCVLIQWHDAEKTAYSVVNYNYNPTYLPVVGLDSDLEVLVKRTPYVRPEYDVRLKNLITSYSVSESFDSEYTQNRMWLEEFNLIDREVNDQITSVSESENYANYQVFPNEKQLKYLTVAMAATIRYARGLTITTAESDIMDKVIAKGLRIYQNHLLSEAKKDSLNVGAMVDLDYGWQNVDPENEE